MNATTHLPDRQRATSDLVAPGSVQVLSEQGRTEVPALVFAHGMDSDWRVWSPVADTLRHRHDSYALDLPWSSSHDLSWLRHSSPDQGLITALEALPDRPYVLVAHSLAATATLLLLGARDTDLADRPVRRPDAVVLVTPLVAPTDEADREGLYARCQENFSVIQEQGLLARLGSRADRLDVSVKAALVSKVLARMDHLTRRKFFTYTTEAMSSALNFVDMSTLVVSAPLDPLGQCGWLRTLVNSMPVATLHELTEGGHVCHLEYPTAVATAIGDFLSVFNWPMSTAPGA